jgi:hypothetical protein
LKPDRIRKHIQINPFANDRNARVLRIFKRNYPCDGRARGWRAIKDGKGRQAKVMRVACLEPLDTMGRRIKDTLMFSEGSCLAPRARRVTARHRYSLTDWPGRWRMLALVLVFALGFQTASASTMAPAHAFAGDEHARHCKCVTRCQGASCCCGPREAQTRLSLREPNLDPDRTGASPCMMNSAPCGDSRLPGTFSEVPVKKTATLAIVEPLRLDTCGTLLPFFTHSLLPARRASRLDRPPEMLILA